MLRRAASTSRSLLTSLVFERQAHLGPEGDIAVSVHGEVLFDDLGHPHVTQCLLRRLDCSGGSVLPGLGARADKFGDAVDAHVASSSTVEPSGMIIVLSAAARKTGAGYSLGAVMTVCRASGCMTTTRVVEEPPSVAATRPQAVLEFEELTCAESAAEEARPIGILDTETLEGQVADAECVMGWHRNQQGKYVSRRRCGVDDALRLRWDGGHLDEAVGDPARPSVSVGKRPASRQLRRTEYGVRSALAASDGSRFIASRPRTGG